MLVLLPITLVLLLVTVRERAGRAVRRRLPSHRRVCSLAWARCPVPTADLGLLPERHRQRPAGDPVHPVRPARDRPGHRCRATPAALLRQRRAGSAGWLWLSYRLGKHRTWVAGDAVGACAIFVWVPFLGEGDVLAFAVICGLSGASLGADLAIPASMQADVLDLDQVASGRRRTAFFFAFVEHGRQAGASLRRRHRVPGPGRLGLRHRGTEHRRRADRAEALYIPCPAMVAADACSSYCCPAAEKHVTSQQEPERHA